jgi:hypothetical protein
MHHIAGDVSGIWLLGLPVSKAGSDDVDSRYITTPLEWNNWLHVNVRFTTKSTMYDLISNKSTSQPENVLFLREPELFFFIR